MAVQALIGPAIKALASGSAKKVAMGAAKGAVKDKAKDFVTGKGKKKKGKGGALVKSKDERVQKGQQQSGSIVASTPIVGNYRVESLPDKPDIEGKPSKISFESVNNQLDSIVGLTEVLKKTSQVKLKTANNREKAERKAAEKDKKRQKENLLEKGAGFVGGLAKGMVSKAAPFDPLKFFTQIFLGSLLLWITQNGSKIIGFLKAGLAFFNNFGKILKGAFTLLGKGIKAGLRVIGKAFPRLGELGKSIKGIFKTAGKSIKGAFKGIGNGLKNLAKGIIDKIKSLGKFLMNPFGGKKPPKGSPKGIENAAKNAAKKGGKVTNSFRRVLKQHGPEAAERYKQLVDKGMNPAKASRRVNTAVKAGKITSQPAKAVGSKIAKKAGQKSLLTLSKGALKFLKRIPVIGGLITLVVSLLSGDPISQALFKTAGAVLGGFLGSFIPIPVVGTLLGELIGEYTGDLMYHLLKDPEGGSEAVGNKLQEDIKGMLSMGQAALSWAGDGFERLMDGLPKFNVFGLGEIINPLPLLANPLSVIPKVYKAFFTRDPMNKGDVKSEEKPEEIKIQPEMTDPAPDGYREDLENEPTVPMGPGRLASPIASGALTISDVKTTYYDPSLGGINASGFKTDMGLPATSTGEGYIPEIFSAAAFPPLLAKLPSSMTVAAKDFPGGRTLKKPFHLVVTNKNGKKAIIRVNDVGPGVQGHSSNHMLDLSVAAKDYLGTGGGFTIQMAPPNSKSGPLTSETQAQVRPTTPMAEVPQPVEVKPGSPSQQSHSQTPAVPGTGGDSGALKTGLVTGPSAHIGGSADFHIDTQIMKSVPMKQKIDMVDQMAAGYNSQGRLMEFSNSGVEGETWNVNASYDEKVKLLERVFASHSHSSYNDRNSMDYYIPKKGVNRFDKSAEGAEILAPTVGAQSASFSSGGGYGNFVEIKDSKGQVIARTGHGDSRVGGGQGTVSLAGSRQVPSSSTPGVSISTSPTGESKTASSVASISQQLPYETTGSTVVMMTPPSSGGGSVGGGGGAGTPVIIGSGDVVNSYYKSQLLGFLYKQG
jgi:hypothetical protein